MCSVFAISQVVILGAFIKMQAYSFFSMFSYISGTILSMDGIQVTCLVEGTGLGLEIFISPLILANIRKDEKFSFWIHHHKTEASETLFGCSSESERALFRQLLKVSGIGGKTALNLL
jgi:Holliday junction DNA helicase RuvA